MPSATNVVGKVVDCLVDHNIDNMQASAISYQCGRQSSRLLGRPLCWTVTDGLSCRGYGADGKGQKAEGRGQEAAVTCWHRQGQWAAGQGIGQTG